MQENPTPVEKYETPIVKNGSFAVSQIFETSTAYRTVYIEDWYVLSKGPPRKYFEILFHRDAQIFCKTM